MTGPRNDAPALWIEERRFAHDARAALLACLGERPIVPAEQFAAAPVVVSAGYLRQLAALGRVLDTALRAIVGRYFDDPRIRAIYALPPELEAILHLAHRRDDRPYRVGFFRPDFVYDRDGRPRICELGARYPLNGWMISLLAAQAYAPFAADLGLAAQTTQQDFVARLQRLHPPGCTVAMLHAREPGTEIFLLGALLRDGGATFLPTHPAALRLHRGRLHAGEHAVDRCILEMDRTELPLLPAEVLAHLIATGAYFNDVRTLILVHDKRTLAVLWDAAIMRDLLSPDDHALLRAFLIPSWTIGRAEACAALLARPDDMVAKRSSGGRGIDTVVRSTCGETAWRERVGSQWAQDMYQPYLAQRDFRLPGDRTPIRLVGMQLCQDGISYGAGVFRGSDAQIINVHGQRGRLFAALRAA